MKLRITTLSENMASKGNFIGEWGLSVLVETGESTVLFDTGKGSSTTFNADSIGIDFGAIDKIALSHGHYDHTGGLRDVLRRTRKEIDIIAHEDIWQQKYAGNEDKADRYIGIPYRREELESLGARFKLSAGPVALAENIMTTGEVPMLTGFERIDPDLFIREDGRLKPDPLRDDQSLVVHTSGGLVIILGCAHRGMINNINQARKITGVEKVRAVIGGSHLAAASEEQIWQTIAAIREMEVEKLGLCHCTDVAVMGLMAGEFTDRFVFNKAGTIIEF